MLLFFIFIVSFVVLSVLSSRLTVSIQGRHFINRLLIVVSGVGRGFGWGGGGVDHP